MNLSKSSYFYCKKHPSNAKRHKHERERIKVIFNENEQCYGYRRIHLALRNEGIVMSEKVVRRLMKEEGIKVLTKYVRKYSAYFGETLPAADDLLQRDFSATKPNEKWVSDITEFKIPAGKVYLSPIIDCFDKAVIGFEISTSPNAELANKSLLMAIGQLQEGEQPIIHTDRGGHYRWPGWLKIVEEHGLKRSMSRIGKPQDNAACEGFFGRLKMEFFYNRKWDNVTIPEFIEQLRNYINWYNNDRISLTLGGQSPRKYREELGLAA
jgi:putative transposase